MKEKLTIGIPASSLGENSFGATKYYLEFMSKFGNPRIIMPWEEFVKVDMLLLPGGQDINPSSYGEVPGFSTSNTDVFKNFFFENRLKRYIEEKVPVLGICLGFQQLGVYFGSKLTQDFIFHAQSPDRWKKAHELKKYVENGNHLKVKTEVNSHHHQGITLNDLNMEELTPIYLAENEDSFITGHDYIVEAFKHKTLKVLGVQWHPKIWGLLE